MNRRKWFLTRKEFFTVLFFFVITPPLLNYILFTWKAPWTFGEGDNWLGFWGNYSGAFVGALVALWIANRQAVEQREILKKQIDEQRIQELEKEARSRKIEQAPYLIQIQFELKQMLKQMQKINDIKKERIAVHEGYIRNRTEREELTTEEKKEAWKDVESEAFEIKLINNQVLSHFQGVDDIELQIQLIECFTFYTEFSEVISVDLQIVYEEFSKSVKGILRENQKEFISRYQQYAHVRSKIAKEKKRVWLAFEREDQIGKLINTLERIEKEIEDIRQTKTLYKNTSI
ncbi:hypothetical protein [Priestia megaterium]|uniref:hypothetical protein n=1 Tax=Priestia megaterium TaxID=1404 RepID=UPI0012B9F622|nr:hypothetical protein [Priestia megaterium]